jgi:hypothetical protein
VLRNLQNYATSLGNGNNPSEAEDCQNNIKEFSPYVKENTTFHHFKDQPVNGV